MQAGYTDFTDQDSNIKKLPLCLPMSVPTFREVGILVIRGSAGAEKIFADAKSKWYDSLTMQNVLSLEKEALRANQEELFAFVEQALINLNMPASHRDRMMLALDEALTNVVLYAYPEDRRGTVGIHLSRDDNTITAEIVDHGKPFDPTANPAPDVTLPIEQRPIGGLGIHLMRNMVTSLRYYRKQGENHLVLTTAWEETG